MGYGRGWASGTDVRSKPYTHIPQEDWDRIFKKPKADMFVGSPEYLERTKKEWLETNGDRPAK